MTIPPGMRNETQDGLDRLQVLFIGVVEKAIVGSASKYWTKPEIYVPGISANPSIWDGSNSPIPPLILLLQREI